MVRAPCCVKMGLKRGLWTPEEDRLLINHINTHGHANWRSLPRLAGLLRCGKSCRLRWINYLRPDIKRGNFTREEEEMIFQLHETLGNRWSAIAAKLPGRTDNEIKNVWHTHLKNKNIKTLQPQQDTADREQKQNHSSTEENEKPPLSPPQCPSSDDVSTLTTTTTTTTTGAADQSLDDDFWQILSADNNNSDGEAKSFAVTGTPDDDGKFQGVRSSSCAYNNADYWFDVYMGAQEFPKF